ncbi:MAG: hypothetical protein IT439_10095 [Phycisphaerales bacterium]|nr:hypothetical protein [Phycisphaerales bacterium]
MNQHIARRARSLVGSLALAGVLAGATGCNNAGQGFLSGASLGALGGMAIGSLSGNMGEGAVAGAVLGGIGGLILGDQNARHSEPRGYYGYDDGYRGYDSGYRGGYGRDNCYPY